MTGSKTTIKKYVKIFFVLIFILIFIYDRNSKSKIDGVIILYNNKWSEILYNNKWSEMSYNYKWSDNIITKIIW